MSDFICFQFSLLLLCYGWISSGNICLDLSEEVVESGLTDEIHPELHIHQAALFVWPLIHVDPYRSFKYPTLKNLAEMERKSKTEICYNQEIDNQHDTNNTHTNSCIEMRSDLMVENNLTNGDKEDHRCTIEFIDQLINDKLARRQQSQIDVIDQEDSVSCPFLYEESDTSISEEGQSLIQNDMSTTEHSFQNEIQLETSSLYNCENGVTTNEESNAAFQYSNATGANQHNVNQHGTCENNKQNNSFMDIRPDLIVENNSTNNDKENHRCTIEFIDQLINNKLAKRQEPQIHVLDQEDYVCSPFLYEDSDTSIIEDQSLIQNDMLTTDHSFQNDIQLEPNAIFNCENDISTNEGSNASLQYSFETGRNQESSVTINNGSDKTSLIQSEETFCMENDKQTNMYCNESEVRFNSNVSQHFLTLPAIECRTSQLQNTTSSTSANESEVRFASTPVFQCGNEISTDQNASLPQCHGSEHYKESTIILNENKAATNAKQPKHTCVNCRKNYSKTYTMIFKPTKYQKTRVFKVAQIGSGLFNRICRRCHTFLLQNESEPTVKSVKNGENYVEDPVVNITETALNFQQPTNNNRFESNTLLDSHGRLGLFPVIQHKQPPHVLHHASHENAIERQNEVHSGLITNHTSETPTSEKHPNQTCQQKDESPSTSRTENKVRFEPTPVYQCENDISANTDFHAWFQDCNESKTNKEPSTEFNTTNSVSCIQSGELFEQTATWQCEEQVLSKTHEIGKKISNHITKCLLTTSEKQPKHICIACRKNYTKKYTVLFKPKRYKLMTTYIERISQTEKRSFQRICRRCHTSLLQCKLPQSVVVNVNKDMSKSSTNDNQLTELNETGKTSDYADEKHQTSLHKSELQFESTLIFPSENQGSTDTEDNSSLQYSEETEPYLQSVTTSASKSQPTTTSNGKKSSMHTCISCKRNYSKTYTRVFKPEQYKKTTAILSQIAQTRSGFVKRICRRCHETLSQNNLTSKDIDKNEQQTVQGCQHIQHICIVCQRKYSRGYMIVFKLTTYQMNVNSILSHQQTGSESSSKLICRHCHNSLLKNRLPEKSISESERNLRRAANRFERAIRQKAAYVCVSCHRLLYKKTVSPYKNENYQHIRNDIREKVFNQKYLLRSAENSTWICLTCHRHIQNNKVPPQSKANKMELDIIPSELTGLTPLELRLISLRIPFMRIISLPKGKQKSIHGPAVNVPASLKPISSLLPRLPKEAHIIPLKLKRRLKYKQSYMSNYIRPLKVQQALQYLIAKNPLYKSVQLNKMWQNQWRDEDPDLWDALNNNPNLIMKQMECDFDEDNSTQENDEQTTKEKNTNENDVGEPSSMKNHETDENESLDEHHHELDYLNNIPDLLQEVQSDINDDISAQEEERYQIMLEQIKENGYREKDTTQSTNTKISVLTNHPTAENQFHDEDHNTLDPLNNQQSLLMTHMKSDFDEENSRQEDHSKLPTQTKTTESPSMTKLTAAAGKRGYEVHDVPSDGSCMFHAISRQLGSKGIRVNACKLRDKAADYLQQHKDRYEHFICTHVNHHQDTPNRDEIDEIVEEFQSEYPHFAQDILWERYIGNLRNGSWGDDIVLQAIADMFQIQIEVLHTPYTFESPEQITVKIPRQTSEANKRKQELQTIYLGFIPQHHYVEIKPVHVNHLERLQQPSSLSNRPMEGNGNKKSPTSDNMNNVIVITNSDQSKNLDIDNQDQAEFERTIKLTGLPYDTCLQQETSTAMEDVFSLAPGEGNTPLSILCDKYFEEMANPNKFPNGTGGLTDETRPTPLSMNKYINSRLLDVDGRFAKDIDYVLSTQYAIDHMRVQNAISIALRQTSGQGAFNKKWTAGDIKDDKKIQTLIRHDKAYHFLKNVRGSPPYWQKMFLETLAMMRQNGIPTWFFTLSAADMQWPEVIQSVAAQYNVMYTDDDIKHMTWETKSRWLRTNPVTAARHFDYRLNTYFAEFLKSDAHPIGEITDYVIRIEFQARGSPHAHTLIWIRHAPKLKYSDDVEVTSFIDKYVTCKLPSEDDPIYESVNKLQRHSCSSKCRRYNTCRFHFPKPPASTTIIAKKCEAENAASKLKKTSEIISKVKQALNNIDELSNITLDDILNKQQITLEDYMTALATNKHGYSVILERSPTEININAYNKHILSTWKANHDLQYVVDAYAAIMYVASYVLKAEKGMGHLLQSAAKESANQNIRTQLRKAGSVFLTHREVTAQEAVFRALSIPLRKMSRTVIFINTSTPDNRVSLLLPKNQIQDKDDDDDDIFCMSMIDRYSYRPNELEDLCLAEFIANFTQYRGTNLNDENPTHVKKFALKDNKGYIYKRRKEAVIRWHSLNQDSEPDKYYRSKIMLFFPWRNENALQGIYDTFKEKYDKEFQTIKKHEDRYTHDEGELNELYKDIIENGVPENAWESVSPNFAQEEHEAYAEGSNVERPLEVDSNDIHIDIQTSMPTKPSRTNNSLLFTKAKNIKMMSTKKYKQQMRYLNTKQREVVNYHRQWCKTVVTCHKTNQPVKPYQLFLSGPGGVGKSYVIRMIHHDTINLLRHSPFISASDVPILLTASTGVAAYNIQGMTIHSALSLTNRKKSDGSYLPLSADRGNTLQAELEQLHVLIIDEISMIGARTLLQIHRRLQEIKKMEYSNNRFGNTTIIAVGDLYQLPPFKDQKVFSIPGTANNPTMEMLQEPLWSECFQLHELDEVVRQRDINFVNILNKVRKGESPAELDNFVVTQQSQHYKKDALHVFGTNKKCNIHNMHMLQTLEAPIHTIPAVDCKKDRKTGQLNVDISTKKRTDTGGLETNLSIAEGAKVKLTTNIDVADGLSNGARGVVSRIIISNDKVQCVLVTFENDTVGLNARNISKYKQKYPRAVPIERHGVSFYLSRGAEITRTQFPLTLAWASTIHSVQGLTVDNIVVDMADMFDYAQAYVAFSRVRTVEGLQILNKIQPEKIKSDPKVEKEMQRLRTNILQCPKSPDRNIKQLRIGHLNVGGYLNNLQDILYDEILRTCDIFAITETHLKKSQTIPAMNQPNPTYVQFRRDRNTDNDKGGVLILASSDLRPKLLPIEISNLEFIAIKVETRQGSQLQVVALYKPPNSLSAHVFMEKLKQLLKELLKDGKKTIILGDFNEDLLVHENTPTKTLMNQYGLTQHIKHPTTDYGSMLDHIYDNLLQNNKNKYHVTDTYYSDHDLIIGDLSVC